jgi:hypothetical protein
MAGPPRSCCAALDGKVTAAQRSDRMSHSPARAAEPVEVAASASPAP